MLSKVCLDNGYKVFEDEVYKTYLKKRNINKMVASILNSDINLNLQRYIGYDNLSLSFAYIPNNTGENIRKYLDDDNINAYDMKVYQSIIDNHINTPCIVPLSNKCINSNVL